MGRVRSGELGRLLDTEPSIQDSLCHFVLGQVSLLPRFRSWSLNSSDAIAELMPTAWHAMGTGPNWSSAPRWWYPAPQHLATGVSSRLQLSLTRNSGVLCSRAKPS